MLNKILFVLFVASLGSLVVLFNVTSPSSAGPSGVMVAFFCLYIIFLSITVFAITYGTKLIHWLIKIFRFGSESTQQNTLSASKTYYYSSMVAFAPTILLGLQSVGGVNWYEALLVLAFVVMSCFYIAKRF